MWRPKGWENPTPNLWDDVAYEAYEAGADAMHKADIEWLVEYAKERWDLEPFEQFGYMEFKMSIDEFMQFKGEE